MNAIKICQGYTVLSSKLKKKLFLKEFKWLEEKTGGRYYQTLIINIFCKYNLIPKEEWHFEDKS